MFYSFRNRLFAISVALLAVFMLGVGIFLHETLRTWTESRIEQDLRDRAELVAAGLGRFDEESGRALVGRIDDTDRQRITLIDADGEVLADTHLTPRQLDGVDYHGDRPEVEMAYESDIGLYERYSETVGSDMLYAAVMADDGESVVRVSVPLREVDEALGGLRLILLVGVVIGVGIAIVMSSVASRMMSTILQRVLDRARDGESDVESATASPDELLERRGETDVTSLSQVTGRLEETLDLLVRERNRFRAVLDGMTDGIIATDGERRVTLTNRPVHRLLGTSDVEGRLLDEVLPEEVVDQLGDDETGGVEFELDIQPRRQIHIRATPRPNTDGMILVVHDVTMLRQLETMRRDFVANVSHELKTPVTIIQANAETLLDGAIDDPTHARSFTEAIHRHGERLSNLIADLLDLSRIESGQVEIERQPIALTNAVDRAADDVVCRLDGVDGCRVRIDDDLVAAADADALHRVLLNLVENAVKYGDTTDGLGIDARADGKGDIVVEVRDDGPGIGEEHQDRIFERFYRVDQGRASDRGGTGLGLSIVKHLVDSMGGEVGYRRDDTGGSIFWFTLPRYHDESTIGA